MATVAAMRPTVFAELAAAEMRSGTECCSRCDYVYYEVAAKCPRCAEPHPFNLDPLEHAVRATRATGGEGGIRTLGTLRFA